MRQPIDTVLLSVYFYIFLLFWTLRSQNVGWILWIWLKLQKLVFCKAYRNRKKMWQQNAPFRKKIILPVSHSTVHRETVPPKMGTVLDQNRELLPSIGLIWGWRVRNNLRLFLTLMMKQFLQIYINWGSLGNHQGNGLHMPCILVWRQTLTTTNMFFSSFASCKSRFDCSLTGPSALFRVRCTNTIGYLQLSHSPPVPRLQVMHHFILKWLLALCASGGI